jgi:hypothetical protein
MEGTVFRRVISLDDFHRRYAGRAGSDARAWYAVANRPEAGKHVTHVMERHLFGKLACGAECRSLQWRIPRNPHGTVRRGVAAYELALGVGAPTT